MEGSFHRIARVMMLGTKAEALHALTHIGNTVATLIGKVLRVVLVLVMYWTIAYRVPNIPLWDTERFIFLGLTFYSIDLIASVFFHRNLLYYLPNDIHSGRLDRFLMQPLPLLPRIAFQRIDVIDALTAVVVCIYGVTRTVAAGFPIMNVIAFFVLCLFGVIATAGTVLIFGSLAFFTHSQDESGHVVDAVMSIGRFPLTVFPRGIKEIFLYTLPTGLIATIPVIALFDGISLGMWLFVLLYTSILLYSGWQLWNRGLRNYQSLNG